MASIDHSGSLVIHRGLIKPEDRKMANKVVARGTDGEEGDEGNGPQVTTGNKPEISEALCRKLTAHRTRALQVLVAGNTHVALAALVHSLLNHVVLQNGYRGESCLQVRANDNDSELTRSADDMEASTAWTQLQGTLDQWKKRLPGDSDKLLPWLIEQPQDILLELMALCTALSINTVTAREGEHASDALATAVGLDMADWWAPTGASYLAQVSKEQIVKAVTEAVSIEAGAPLTKLKKAEAVARAETLLTGTRWLPTVLRKQAA